MAVIPDTSLVSVLQRDARRLCLSLCERKGRLAGANDHERFNIVIDYDPPPWGKSSIAKWYGSIVTDLKSMCDEMNFAPLELAWTWSSPRFESDKPPRIRLHVFFVQI